MKSEHIIYGRRAVLEAIRSGASIEELYCVKAAHGLSEIEKAARALGIRIKESSNDNLTQWARNSNHQGIVARMGSSEFVYADMEAIFSRAEERHEKAMIAILDEIVDPHNLGAIIRSAVCAGFHGIIISRHHSAEINATVMKTSAGAAVHIPIVQVTNLAQTLTELKEKGVWIYGTAMEAEQNYFDIDADDHIGLVIGSEGSGMRRLTKEKCDFLIKIPMSGPVASLNASVAAGIIFFEVRRHRGGLNKQ